MAAKRPGREGRPWRRAKERVRRTQNTCHLCGHPIDKTLRWPHPMSFTVDHIIPVSTAPELARDPRNLAAAHLTCNSSKQDGRHARKAPGQLGPTSEAW